MSLDLLLRAHVRTGRDRRARAASPPRSTPWPPAASTTTSAAASPATRSTSVWLVPHFEKMLYDHALLTRLYLHAWQVTGEARYRQVLAETIDYVLRDLRQPAAASPRPRTPTARARRASSTSGPREQVREVLGDDADAAAAWWGVGPGGNFEGATILNRMHARGELARPPEIEAARQALFGRPCAAGAARPRRQGPHRVERPDDRHAGRGRRGHRRARPGWPTPSRRPSSCSTSSAATTAAGCARGRPTAAPATSPSPPTTPPWSTRSPGWPRPPARPAGSTRPAPTADALLDLFWDEARRLLHDRPRRRGARRPPQGPDGQRHPGGQQPRRVGPPPPGRPHRRRPLPPGRRPTCSSCSARWPRSTPPPSPTSWPPPRWTPWALTEVAVAGDAPDLVAVVQRAYRPNAVLAWGEPYPSPLWEGRRRRAAPTCAGTTPAGPR